MKQGVEAAKKAPPLTALLCCSLEPSSRTRHSPCIASHTSRLHTEPSKRKVL